MNDQALKTIKVEFETELKRDPIYAKTSRNISKLIRDIPKDLKTIARADKEHKALFSASLKHVSQKYKQHIEFYEKGCKITIQKNADEIQKIKRNNHLQMDQLTKQYNQKFNSISENIITIENQYQQRFDDIKKAYKRDLGHYQKNIKQARKQHQAITLEIEKEQKEALSGLLKTFDVATKSREVQRQNLIANYEKHIKAVDTKLTKNTSQNNDVYLNIKTTYNNLSVHFNQAINQLNKQYQQAIKKIKTQFDLKVKPIETSLNKLNQAYKEAIIHVKDSFKKEREQMDADFEQKKQAYENKKARIIHESNEVISLLNSKLTAFKESTNLENIESAKTLRDKMKQTNNENDQNNLQKTIRANLKSTNNELNKQIIRTNKEITAKQRDFQLRLFNHDLTYLKTINDWRLNKNLLHYKQKQSLAKIELNFNYNINQSKTQLSLYESSYKHQQTILNLSLERDLLTLETQLKLGSYVQERELNLLTNDQQLAINDAKLKKETFAYEHKVALEELDHLQKQDQLSYDYNLRTVNSNTQLELEKARSERDFTIQEQQIRSDIAKAIYEQNKHLIDLEKQSKMIDFDYTIKLLDIAHEDRVFNSDTACQTRIHQHASFSKKASILSLKQQSLKLLDKQALIDENNLLDIQFQIQQLMNYLLLLHQKRHHLRQLMNELYLIPSHPDIFKQTLQYAAHLDLEIGESMIKYVAYYEHHLRNIFKEKIDQQATYRYVQKYEIISNFLNMQKRHFAQEQQLLETDISHLEQTYVKYQNDVDQNQAFMDQLIKINEQIKLDKIPSQTSYDYKENMKLIKKHQYIIAHLKDNMKRLDHLLSMKREEITTLTKHLSNNQKQLELNTKTLTREKNLESELYLRQLMKFGKQFKLLGKKIHMFTNASQSFYDVLKSLVYVTNNSITSAFKKLKINRQIFENSLIMSEQKLLFFALDHYRDYQMINHHFKDLVIKNSQKYLDHIQKIAHQFQHDTVLAVHLHQTTFEKQKHVLTKNKKHQTDIIKLNLEKEKQRDIHTIKQLEEKLEQHLQHSQSELNALNENQQATALQYIKEYEQKLDTLKKEHLKHLASFKSQSLHKENDLANNNASLQSKNQNLISQYTTQHSKALDLMKNKSQSLHAQMQAHQATINKDYLMFDKEQVIKEKQRKENIKNIHNHLNRFEAQAESKQKAVLNKETKSLKRHLNFKLKSLKLN